MVVCQTALLLKQNFRDYTRDVAVCHETAAGQKETIKREPAYLLKPGECMFWYRSQKTTQGRGNNRGARTVIVLPITAVLAVNANSANVSQAMVPSWNR